MPTIKLTRRTIEGLPAPHPSGRQVIFWDEGMRGFGVLVSGTTATKSFVVQRKIKGAHRTRRITLDRVDVIDLETARQRAITVLAELGAGVDPKAERRRRARRGETVGQVFEAYLKASPNLSANSLGIYRRVFARHLAHWWADLPLRSIDGDAVERRYREITAAVAVGRARGEIRGGGGQVDGRAVAVLAMRLFKAMWSHQSQRDVELPPCPTGRLRKQWHHLERRTRHVPSEDLGRFYAAALRLPSPIGRDMVLLGLFTGMRAGEVRGLRWDEVDLPNRVIRVAAGRMKAGKRFDLPLSDIVRDLLVARRALGRDGPFVFPGNSAAGHSSSFGNALRQIGAATGIKVSPHDLRRTFITVAEGCEISPLSLKLLVSHSTGSDVTAGYVQMSTAQLREPAQRVADRLKELCGIEPVEGVAKMEAAQ
jgi:integrase